MVGGEAVRGQRGIGRQWPPLDACVRYLYGSRMMRRRTRQEIQIAAALLRQRGGLPASAPILDAADLARTATSLRVYQRPLPLGIRGLLASVGGSRPALVVNARLPVVDRNVSAAHELGHWLLHADTTPWAAGRGERRRREWEADRFALELLLPGALVRRVLAERRCSMGAAAARLGVRGTYLSRRIRELRLADQPFFRRGSPVRGFSDTT
ncbi:MAG: ImmA/IrrE family metallo-endopeptidase [Chloroflexi bacterium]|nr:ImmA/IrrE family metallo-endopeptidase [Chloroflexota bacterium]